MRPPEFTGGNFKLGVHAVRDAVAASMRPPEFTGGNSSESSAHRSRRWRSFNEAAGIHRRKHDAAAGIVGAPDIGASMRPPEFTGGNVSRFTRMPSSASSLQ